MEEVAYKMVFKEWQGFGRCGDSSLGGGNVMVRGMEVRKKKYAWLLFCGPFRFSVKVHEGK